MRNFRMRDVAVRAGKAATILDVLIAVQVVHLAALEPVAAVHWEHVHVRGIRVGTLHTERSDSAEIRKITETRRVGDLTGGTRRLRIPEPHGLVEPRLRRDDRPAHAARAEHGAEIPRLVVRLLDLRAI